MSVFRKSWLAWICLLVTTMVLATTSAFAQPESVDYEVRREIFLSEYDYAFYNDTYIFKDTALDWIDRSGAKWSVGFPAKYTNKGGNVPLYPIAYASDGRRLNITKGQEGDLVWFTIDLPEVARGSQQQVAIQMELFFTGTTIPAESTYGKAGMGVVDQSAYKVQGGPSRTRVTIPNALSLQQPPPFFSYVEGSNSTIISSSAVTFETPRETIVRVNVKKPLGMATKSVQKHLVYDPLFGVTIEDGYSIQMGNSLLTNLSVSIPSQAYDVKGRDLTGDLPVRVSGGGNLSVKTVSLDARFYLYYNINYTFYVSYKLPASSAVRGSGDLLIISSQTMSNFSKYTNTARVEVSLPIGARFNGFRIAGFSVHGLTEGDRSFHCEVVNATDLILGSEVSAEFSYSPLWAGYSPGMVASIIGLAAVAVAFPIRYRSRGGPSPIQMKTESGLRKEFARQYVNMLELQNSVQESEDSLILGEISRKDYRSKRDVVDEQLAKTTKTVAQLRSRLEEVDVPTRSTLKDLEALETELYGKRASLRELGSRFLNRKISKKSYKELSDRYTREAESLTQRILGLLHSL